MPCRCPSLHILQERAVLDGTLHRTAFDTARWQHRMLRQQRMSLLSSLVGYLKKRCAAACQGLIKKEGKQRFGSQYSAWQRSPAMFEISGHAPVRSPPCPSSIVRAASFVLRETACDIAVRKFSCVCCNVRRLAGNCGTGGPWRGSTSWRPLRSRPSSSRTTQ